MESLFNVRVKMRRPIAIVYTNDNETFRSLIQSLSRETAYDTGTACYLAGGAILLSPDADIPVSVAHELCHAFCDVCRIAQRRGDWAEEGLACMISAAQLGLGERLQHLGVICAWARMAIDNPGLFDLFNFSYDRKWYALAECFVRDLLRRAQDRPVVWAAYRRILRANNPRPTSSRARLAAALNVPWKEAIRELRLTLATPELLDVPLTTPAA